VTGWLKVRMAWPRWLAKPLSAPAGMKEQPLLAPVVSIGKVCAPQFVFE